MRLKKRFQGNFSEIEGLQGPEAGVSSASGQGVIYAYDTAGRLSSETNTIGTSRALSFQYDAASNRTATANDQTFGFGYTPASQISSRSASNDNYNWIGATITNRAYARNGLNQYTNVGGTNFAYDARGNLTSDGARTFVYDLENRLLSVSGSASLTLAYDPLGRLRQTTAASVSTDFLYDGDRLSAEYNAAGAVLRRTVHGPGVDEPLVWYEGAGLSDRRYLITNHQGSVIAENGATTSIYRYGPYGEPDTWTGSRFRYTGQIALPEVGLYHYKARVYDPALGRFLQTDPVGYTADLDLYTYVGNDPLNRTDPTGNCLWCIGAVIGAAVGAGFETVVRLSNNGGDFESLDAGRIGAAALVGAVTGATGGLAGGGAAAAITATRGAQAAGSLGGRIAVGVATGSAGGAAGEATRQGDVRCTLRPKSWCTMPISVTAPADHEAERSYGFGPGR